MVWPSDASSIRSPKPRGVRRDCEVAFPRELGREVAAKQLHALALGVVARNARQDVLAHPMAVETQNGGVRGRRVRDQDEARHPHAPQRWQQHPLDRVVGSLRLGRYLGGRRVRPAMLLNCVQGEHVPQPATRLSAPGSPLLGRFGPEAVPGRLTVVDLVQERKEMYVRHHSSAAPQPNANEPGRSITRRPP